MFRLVYVMHCKHTHTHTHMHAHKHTHTHMHAHKLGEGRLCSKFCLLCYAQVLKKLPIMLPLMLKNLPIMLKLCWIVMKGYMIMMITMKES